jgi:hypothetical protein
MRWVGLEPTIPVFERGKTVHALDCAATCERQGQLYLNFYWVGVPYVWTLKEPLVAMQSSIDIYVIFTTGETRLLA